MSGGRTLVTGAGGFIGRHVVPLLVARGHAVHAVVRRPTRFDPGVRVHEIDLRDRAASRALLELVRPTALLHLAWIVTPGVFWASPDNLDWVAASLTLARDFAACGGSRAVFAGTCAEYDWSESVLDEASTKLRPRTLYGAAKNGLQNLLAAAAPALGLSLAWGRVFFLYGPGEAKGRLVPDVIDALLEGRPAPCGPGTQLRDVMHVADVARAFVALLESDVAGPVNIASGTCRPLRDLILPIGEILGRPDLIRLGARPMPPDEPAELRAVTTILRDRVGFRPCHGLEAGLAAVCAAARAARIAGSPKRLSQNG